MSVKLFIKYSRLLVLVLILIVGVILVVTNKLPTLQKNEPFGTSPGTMDQLQTSHVPTQEDYNFYTRVYPKMVRREITDMTDGDPGELRPWIFPWYGRGVTLIAT
jgi:hypothetical protein